MAVAGSFEHDVHNLRWRFPVLDDTVRFWDMRISNIGLPNLFPNFWETWPGYTGPHERPPAAPERARFAARARERHPEGMRYEEWGEWEECPWKTLGWERCGDHCRAMELDPDLELGDWKDEIKDEADEEDEGDEGDWRGP